MNALAIEDLHDVSMRMVVTELNLPYPGWIKPAALEKSIDRLYSTNFFERVTYRLDPLPQGMILTVRVIEKNTNFFRVGLRYDRETKASLLLGLSLRNLAEHGSGFVFETRLGEEVQIDAQYFIHVGWLPLTGFRGRGVHQRNTIFLYDQSQRVASVRYHATSVEAFLGTIFSNPAKIGLGRKQEYAH